MIAVEFVPSNLSENISSSRSKVSNILGLLSCTFTLYREVKLQTTYAKHKISSLNYLTIRPVQMLLRLIDERHLLVKFLQYFKMILNVVNYGFGYQVSIFTTTPAPCLSTSQLLGGNMTSNRSNHRFVVAWYKGHIG